MSAGASARDRIVLLVALALLTLPVLVALPQPAVAAEPTTASPEQQLAERYAPVVVVREQDSQCGSGEPYRPVSVDAVLGHDDIVLRDANDRVVKRAPTAADLAGLPAGFYLDLPGDPLASGCDYERWFQRTSANVPDSVYARVTTDPGHPGTLVLQYWFYWVFNDWNDVHESDWEMVQLSFPASTAEEALATSPTTVAFAQHEGVEVADWASDKVLRDGDHVAVYPSQGSHAAYYTQSQWFGRGASAGFGCDNTGIDDGLDARVLRPVTPVLGTGGTTPQWLTFEGRWGERELSVNNGPTGPNMKRQWTEPVTWQLEQGRPDALPIPAAGGAAVDMFCGVTAAASTLLVRTLDNPVLTVGLLVAVIVLLVVVVRATRWRGSPRAVVARRSAGQMLTGAWAPLARRWPAFTLLWVAVVAGAFGALALRNLLMRPQTTGLAHVGAAPEGVVDWLGLGVIGMLAGAGTFFAVAVAQALTVPDRDVMSAAFGRPTRRGWWRLLLSYLGVTLCSATVIGLPLAAYLVARWAVAPPAAVVADLPRAEAGRRSAELVRGRRVRAFTVTVGAAVLAVVTGPLLGAIVVLVLPGPFWVGNLIAVGGYALGLCWAGAVLVLHYYDLALAAAEAAVAPTGDEMPSDTLRP